MARAFITGVDGFTGRYLAADLRAAGHEVTGISLDGVAGSYKCNLLDAKGVCSVIADAKPDFVFHLAAIAFVAHGDADAIYQTNIIGTRNLLSALSAAPARPSGVLLVSSANIYGNATTGIVTENTAPAPANDYAVSKLAMEMMANLWADHLPITIVRTFNYTGVGQSSSFLLPKITGSFRRRDAVIELGNLDVVRDFSDVRVIVNCYRRLLEAGVSGSTLNVCSGEGYALVEVLQMLRSLTGHAPEVRVNPAFVRTNEVKSLVGSRRLLEQTIGTVSNIPLAETLKWMLQNG